MTSPTIPTGLQCHGSMCRSPERVPRQTAGAQCRCDPVALAAANVRRTIRELARELPRSGWSTLERLVERLAELRALEATLQAEARRDARAEEIAAMANAGLW